MNIEAIKNSLKLKFQHLDEVAPDIFCATDIYQDKPYAVRYFDLSDNIASHSEDLNKYLEHVLGEDYFDIKRPIDLRWNNYLYFITSDQHQQNEAFIRAKSIIESDREYARKFVITETDLPKFLLLSPRDEDRPVAPIQDLYSTWLKLLNKQQFGYLLDFNLSAPEIVRKIGTGELGKIEQAIPVGELNEAERDAISHPIQNLVKTGFRKYPKESKFQFGSRVNLITGSNGHGKTSLLETIEYLYCGSTYRNGTPDEYTHITASLINSPETLETDSIKTQQKRLKARNLGWYGKNDVRGNSLDKSFARFNFMDTDAAIRLSVEETPEQLSEDIARIVLGAEAGKASDQIQRIHIELEKQRKVNENDSSQLSEKIQLLEKEKDSLNAMTKQSDTFFQQLNQHLKTMHWTNRPDNAGETSINTLSENIAAASHQCKLLEGSNLDDLKKQRQELELSNQSLSTLVEIASNFDTKMKSLTTKKEQVSHKFKFIEELQAYSGSDLLALDLEQKELTATINGLQANMPDLRRIDFIDEKLDNLSLDNALSVTDKKLTKVHSEKTETLIRIEEHERSQSMLGNLRDQLISTATKMLESSHEKDLCPLCQSRFKEGQLMLRIAGDTVRDSAPLSVDLRKKLVTLQTSEADLQQTKSLLTAMISNSGDASIETCALVLTRLEEDQRKLSEYQESLKTVTSKLAKHNESGRKVNRLKELMRSLAITEFAPNDLDVLLQSLHSESTGLTKEINSKKAELDDTNQQISALAERAGLSKLLPAAILSKTIATEIKRCDQKEAAAKQLASFLDLKKNFSAIELSHRIYEASNIVSTLITTRKREEETNIRSQQLEQQIKIRRDTLTEKQTTLKHLSIARNALSNILTGQNSLESIKYELLANNAAIISEIFSKIHLPNEYDIDVEGQEIKLIHKGSGQRRSLKEVSTGQRAAFALSLFLTMNKTLGNGPIVLLLDDPISHIDDINMLSFLDYLRELAIDGNRQIFFTTPNAKLASLFRHKFRFLCDNEFKEIRMTR